MRETKCLALQVKIFSSLPTVRNKTDKVKERRSAKLESLAFDSKITSHSKAIRRYYGINVQHSKGWRVTDCSQVPYTYCYIVAVNFDQTVRLYLRA